MIYYVMPIVFLLGIAAIALENKIKVNKSASAILMCVILWGILMFNSQSIVFERGNPAFLQFIQNNHLQNISLKEQLTRFLIIMLLYRIWEMFPKRCFL